MNRAAIGLAVSLACAVLAAVAFASSWLTRSPIEAAHPNATLGSLDLCKNYSGLPPGWREQTYAGMRRVPGGTAQLGSDRGYADERPIRNTQLPPFWIDVTEVTNAQFAAFVSDTGYVTNAERAGWAVVFVPPANDSDATPESWWQRVRGADWRHPQGPGSSIDGRSAEPVVQVTRADALAYARWLGRDLPSEAEWESAAKAGRDNRSADAAVFDDHGRPQANFWQGNFPYTDESQDSFAGRAPVGCYAANGYGLHDVIGNVWEWTIDDYSGSYQPHGTGHAEHAVHTERAGGSEAVIKGGSYLCAENFCVRYRASARHPQEADLPTSHVGFRTVRR